MYFTGYWDADAFLAVEGESGHHLSKHMLHGLKLAVLTHMQVTFQVAADGRAEYADGYETRLFEAIAQGDLLDYPKRPT